MKHTRPLAGLLTTCALSALSLVAHADTVALDPTYGTGGKVVDANNGATQATILLYGNKTLVLDQDGFGISRYLFNGALDTTFGVNGRVNTSFGGPEAAAYSMAVQPDGKIIVGGTANVNSNGVYYSAIARYSSEGVLDTTFAGDGKLTYNAGTVYALVVQGDGKIVGSGGLTGTNGGIGAGGIVRLNSDGSYDTTFNSGGKLAFNPGTTTYFNSGYRGLAVQADGKIVVTGGWNDDFATSRFNVNGSPDTTFGTNGTVLQDFGSAAGPGTYDVSQTLALVSNGKILVAGQRGSVNPVGPPEYRAAFVRYNSNGSLDTTFGTNGRLTSAYSSADSIAYALKPLGNTGGKFLVAGTTNGNFVVARYLDNGSFDTTFNTIGFATADFGSPNDTAYSLAIQADGKIILGGATGVPYELALAKFAVTTTSSAAPSASQTQSDTPSSGSS